MNTQSEQRGIPGFTSDRQVKPECAPFSMEGSNKQAMLLIHGLTGTPQDFRNYARYYFDAGYDVFVPLWPGHGSHISILERLGYREYFIPFPPLMRWLRERYMRVHITALSYGSHHRRRPGPRATSGHAFFSCAGVLSDRTDRKKDFSYEGFTHAAYGAGPQEKNQCPGQAD